VLLVRTTAALPTGRNVLLVGSMITTASLSAFACNLALLGFIHRSESAVALLIGHGNYSSEEQNARLATDDCHSKRARVKST
jgi:hypothetical protein